MPEEEIKNIYKAVKRLRAVYSLAGLLPEVDVFQVAHSGQSTQLQTLHSVPSHGQLVHCTQPLKHSGDESKVVEGESQAVQLRQATQLFRQGAEAVSIQRQRLQAAGISRENSQRSLQRVLKIHACVTEQHPTLNNVCMM